MVEGYQPTFATISAGYMGANRPEVSRNNLIHLHDDPKNPRAPGLKAALEERKYRGLTIAFPFDDLSQIIHQVYAAYSKSALLWKGDESGFTVFSKEGTHYIPADDPQYQVYLKNPNTKANYSIYFVLARWGEDDSASMVMPDGLAFYRIRTTSYHSVKNLVDEYSRIKAIWRGPFAGIPFELALVNRQGIGPDGMKRGYPVFTFTMRPRSELQLSSRTLGKALASANQAAADLSLPEPRPERLEGEPHTPAAAPAPEDVLADDVTDAEFTDLSPTEAAEAVSEADLKNLQHGRDTDAMKRLWFATVKGSHLDGEDARYEFLERHAGQPSLQNVVNTLPPEKFDELIVKAAEEIHEHNKDAEAAAALADNKKFHPSVTAEHTTRLATVLAATGLGRHQLYPFMSMILDRSVQGRSSLTSDDISTILAAAGALDPEGEYQVDSERLQDLLNTFYVWESDDAGAKNVLD